MVSDPMDPAISRTIHVRRVRRTKTVKVVLIAVNEIKSLFDAMLQIVYVAVSIVGGSCRVNVNRAMYRSRRISAWMSQFVGPNSTESTSLFRALFYVQ